MLARTPLSDLAPHRRFVGSRLHSLLIAVAVTAGLVGIVAAVGAVLPSYPDQPVTVGR